MPQANYVSQTGICKSYSITMYLFNVIEQNELSHTIAKTTCHKCCLRGGQSRRRSWLSLKTGQFLAQWGDRTISSWSMTDSEKIMTQDKVLHLPCDGPPLLQKQWSSHFWISHISVTLIGRLLLWSMNGWKTLKFTFLLLSKAIRLRLLSWRDRVHKKCKKKISFSFLSQSHFRRLTSRISHWINNYGYSEGTRQYVVSEVKIDNWI